MDTKIDAKTSGWGITCEKRVGRVITGQILWGSALGDCTREEKQRGVVRGESKGGTHYGENLYGGDIIGEGVGRGVMRALLMVSPTIHAGSPNPGIS